MSDNSMDAQEQIVEYLRDGTRTIISDFIRALRRQAIIEELRRNVGADE